MRFAFHLAAPIVLAVSSATAQAQGLQVAPVIVELAAGQMATTLTVTNAADSAVTVQIRPFAWEQSGDTDRLLPTEDIVVSPPIAEIRPNATQTVRIVTHRPAGTIEVAYRLLLDQIPSSAGAPGVQFALRLSLPLFLEPPGRTPPLVTWRITADGQAVTLRATNRGNSRTRLLTPELLAGLRRLSVVADGNPYILPRTERAWRIAGGAALRPGSSARLTGLTDTGRIDVAVPVTGP